MRLLTLPFRYWWATTVIVLVFWWVFHGVAQTDMQGDWVWNKQTHPAVKAAIMRCGPNYQYRMLYDGTLQVNRGNGWERLRYDRK
jgi:hypothetical protein